MLIMVAVYPYVGDRERDAALARIAARHQRWGDSRWSEAGWEGDDPARDVLAYLHRRHPHCPREVSSADALDALVLAASIHWEERRRERDLLRRARSYGHSLGELGAFLGLATRQATYEYLDRLEALVDAHATDQPRQERVARERTQAQLAADGQDRDPDAVAGPLGAATLPATQDLYRRTRGRRASAAGADVAERRERRREQRARPTREAWLAAAHPRIDGVVGDLLNQCARLGFEAVEQETEETVLQDYLAILARHRQAGDYRHPTMSALGLVLGELRHREEVTALARNHGIHQAIAAANRLRAGYSALTPTSGT